MNRRIIILMCVQGYFVDVSIIQFDATRAFNVLKYPSIPPASYKFPKTDVFGHSRSVCVTKWLADFHSVSYSAKLTDRSWSLFQRGHNELEYSRTDTLSQVFGKLSGRVYSPPCFSTIRRRLSFKSCRSRSANREQAYSD